MCSEDSEEMCSGSGLSTHIHVTYYHNLAQQHRFSEDGNF